MDPCPDEVPARSRSFGNIEKTEGVKPLVVGGSPTDNPISL